MEKKPGFIPGAKTFEPFRTTVPEGEVTIVDTYFGKRGSGGMAVVSLNETPFLLIQYRGGESPRVDDSEVTQINDFLKEALREAEGARLSRPFRQDLPRYENGHYGYIGLGLDNIWSLRYVELIYRIDKSRHPRSLWHGKFWETMSDVMINGLSGGQNWVVFYHVLTHQLLH